jgi:hypothetical protein
MPLLAGALSACAGDGGTPAAPGAPLVIGVSCDQALEPLVAQLSVQATLPGGVVAEQLWSIADGAPAFPREVQLPSEVLQQSLTVTVVARDAEGLALVARHARTVVAPGPTRLLRVRLNDECLESSEEPDVSCPGATCVAGFCEDPYVSPSDLEPYAPGWYEPRADACAPRPDGSPTVEIGRDGEPFVPLQSGSSLVPNLGPQGGSHVWIAVRMQNLHDDAITKLRGDFPESGVAGSVQTTPTAYQPVNGACELQHVRYVLPNAASENVLMRLGVTVLDGTGNAQHEHLDVQVESAE